MKVLVPVKRVIDYNVKVRVKADGTGVDICDEHHQALACISPGRRSSV